MPVRSIIISANSRLAFLENKQVLRLLSRDDLDLAELGIGVNGDGETKTALFCVIHVSSRNFMRTSSLEGLFCSVTSASPKSCKTVSKAELGIGVNGDGETKTALFCVIPDSDKSYNFIIGMLYTQIFQEDKRVAVAGYGFPCVLEKRL